MEHSTIVTAASAGDSNAGDTSVTDTSTTAADQHRHGPLPFSQPDIVADFVVPCVVAHGSH
jgi:hypothetical protein